MEQRARLAEASDQLLCIGTHDDVLELWDLRADRRLRTHRLPGLQQVLALSDGCVTRSAGTALRFSRGGPPQILEHGVSAAARDGARGVLLATGRAVVAYDAAGKRRASYSADVGIAALTRVRRGAGQSWIAVGYKDGGVELLPTSPQQRRPGFSFEDTPASQVVRLIQGPAGTVVAGYANGLVGLWSLKNGIRLEQRRIHGPVIHLLLLGSKLHAASALGQYTTLDLSVFGLPYCELLRRVWARIPVVWEGGLPLRRPPPNRHRCR